MELIEGSITGIEFKEREPKVSYHFFFSPHGTAEDFKNLAKAYQEADIYVPEIYNWTQELKSALQSLSKGELTLNKIYKLFPDLSRSSARRYELEIIYNSKKPILIVDASVRDFELKKEQGKVNFLWREAIDNFIYGHFQESLSKLRDYIKTYANFLTQREIKIKENLKTQIQEFLKQNSDYCQKENLKVLVRLGGYHTKVYGDLVKEKLDVSREFSQMPYVYYSLDEARRRIVFGKEVDDLLLARGLIENLLDPYLSQLTQDNQKISQVLRKISSQLTLKDIEQISRNIAEISINDFNIVNELERFNIRIPKSEEEIDEMLK